MTIVESIKCVLQQNNDGLTSKQIYDEIIRQGLYSFGAENPVGVVNAQLRRRCIGLDFPTAYPIKFFEIAGYEGKKIKFRLISTENTATIITAPKTTDITEIPNDLVWEFLLKGDCRSPWGSDMKYLFSLYQGENLGEEKSVLGEVDREKIPVTGNSRFGCWCCTMVKEDKSLQNFINKGATELIPLREFRNELLRMRENSQYRDSKRRNGSVYKKSDGSFGMGPFTLEARCLILEKLLDLENRTGMELITEAELKAIDKMWDEEGDLTCRALVETYHKVKGKKLPWDDYKTPRFDDEAIQAIRDVADKYDIPVELITKLIVSVDTNKHITKNNKMQKAFDSIIGQGWLHYNSVEGALNHED